MSSETNEKISSKKWLWVSAGVLALVAGAAFYFSQQVVYSPIETSNAPAVARVDAVLQDVRLRKNHQTGWEPAAVGESLQPGDSLFTGENSQARLTLMSGGRVSLDPNSMINFVRIKEHDLGNFVYGDFKIEVRGNAHIGINGQPAEIAGQDTELFISLRPEREPIYQARRGGAQLRLGGEIRRLGTEAVVIETPPPKEEEKAPHVQAESMKQVVYHRDRLYDFYELRDDQLTRMKERRPVVDSLVFVPWSFEGPVENIQAQISDTAEFTNVLEQKEFPVAERTGSFTRSILGLNYFRFSLDGQSWTHPETVEVRAIPLDEAPPEIKPDQDKYVFLNHPITVTGQLSGDSNLKNFVLEVCDSPTFEPEKTRVLGFAPGRFAFQIQRAGPVYLRSMGVDIDSRVTAFSPVTQVDLEVPPAPEVPLLSQADLTIFEGDTVNLSWLAKNANNYKISIVDKKGNKLVEEKLKAGSKTLNLKNKGDYEVEISAYDKYGRLSKPARGRVVVQEKPKPVEDLSDKYRRAIAAIDAATISIETKDVKTKSRNSAFSKSRFSIEAGGYTAFSQEQLRSEKSGPQGTSFALRWLGWMGKNGIELSFKTKVMSLASESGADVSPVQAEVRYLRRWNTGIFGKAQWSWVLGYEAYRSVGSLFSPGYDLAKTGVGLAFPFKKKWDAGGEVMLGYGLDSSQKYEVSGYVTRYIKRNWSLGVGYRAHLFSAGSTSTSPLGLPYREGFAEGYTTLRWHY